jgi:hypothetical protein
MRALRAFGKFFWRFMVIFSFIVNFILVCVIIGLVIFIFNIKKDIAEPLINGLHSSFVGLDDATIDWTIPVRANIPVDLDIQLQTDTVVVLNEPVPLVVNALIDLPGINAYGVNARVDLQLPAGLELPVKLDVPVPVREHMDIALDVRAVIPLSETQLHDPFENLRMLFEPLSRALGNLPNNFNEAGELAGDVLSGKSINLLEETEYSQAPWPGFSKTAGLNYTLLNQPVPPENKPVETGIVVLGGIPALDEQLRPELYTNDNTPETVNERAISDATAKGILPVYFRGGMGPYYLEIQENVVPLTAGSQAVSPGTGETPGTREVTETDQGIIPTPSAPGGGG